MCVCVCVHEYRIPVFATRNKCIEYFPSWHSFNSIQHEGSFVAADYMYRIGDVFKTVNPNGSKAKRITVIQCIQTGLVRTRVVF